MKQWVLSVIKEDYKLKSKKKIEYNRIYVKDRDILGTKIREQVLKEAVWLFTNERNRKQVLQHILYCCQENRGHGISNKFKTLKQVYPNTTFRNLNVVKHGDVGIRLDLKMHIYTSKSKQNDQEESEVLSKNTKSSSVQGSFFRSAPRICIKNVCSSICPFRVKKHKTGSLFRPLVLSKTGKSQIKLDR